MAKYVSACYLHEYAIDRDKSISLFRIEDRGLKAEGNLAMIKLRFRPSRFQSCLHSNQFNQAGSQGFTSAVGIRPDNLNPATLPQRVLETGHRSDAPKHGPLCQDSLRMQSCYFNRVVAFSGTRFANCVNGWRCKKINMITIR